MNHKKRNILYVVITLIFVFSLSFTSVKALPNPAAVYCNELNSEFGGYNYHVFSDEKGNQYGVCEVDGNKYEEWQFFSGKAGKSYSYCVKKGYKTETVDGEAVCVVEKNGKLEEIPVGKLMNLGESSCNSENEKPRTKILNSNNGNSLSSSKSLEPENRQAYTYNISDYSYWDWRNPPNGTNYSRYNFAYFDNTSRGWLTSVKDQGACGSCWAFSVVGALESKYEINQNNSRLNPHLSEQHEVSCDHTCFTFPGYEDTCNLGCSGGWMNLALDYIKNNGIVDYACFPYLAVNGTCSNRCSDYSTRLWNITDYTTNVDGIPPAYDLTNEQLKQMLVDNGPLVLGVLSTDDWDPYSGGLFTDYTCDNATIDWYGLNHGVVLVGYNDTGNDSTSYWIIKNQWGASWGDNGYIYIRFGCSGIGLEAEYPAMVNAPDFKPKIVLNSPENDVHTSDSEVLINFTVLNRNSSQSTCDLILNNLVNQTNSSVLNNTPTTFSLNLSPGNYYWHISCWESGLGIVNVSETRATSIDAINLVLVSPANSTATNDSERNFTCNVSSNNNLTNITFYLWNSSSLVYNSSKNISGTSNQSSFDYTFSAEEDYLWNCEAFDNSSNSGFSLDNYTFRYDSTKPIIEVLSPLNDSWYNGLKFNLSSDENLDSCWFELNFSNTSMVGLNSTYFYYINTTYNEGVYNVTFFCNDSAGNLNSTDRYFFNMEKDNPEITLTSPEDNNETTLTSITFYFEVSDGLNISGCELILSGQSSSVIANQSALVNNSLNSITTTLSAGTYYWRINCTDMAENEGTAGARTLIIKTTNRGGGGGGGTIINTINLTNQTSSNQTQMNQSLLNESLGNINNTNETKNESTLSPDKSREQPNTLGLLFKSLAYIYLIGIILAILIAVIIIMLSKDKLYSRKLVNRI